MKPYESQSFYELLEVDSGASPEEIREAFLRAQAIYGADSIALYAVEDPQDAEALRARLAEALDTLSDPERRDAYDRLLGLPLRSRAPLKSEAQTASTPQGDGGDADAPTQLAMTEMLAGAESSHSTHPEYQISYLPRPPRPDAAAPLQPPAPPAEAAPPPPAPAPAPPPAPPAEVAPPPAPAVVRMPPAAKELAAAPQLAEESAIATAEASMAQVTARVREATVARPRPVELRSDGPFNGELLRRVRESKGLSLAQVSDRTRISKSHLENIEADRYEPLPATVYLRGMLVSLARELGLDTQKVAKSYLGLVGERNKA